MRAVNAIRVAKIEQHAIGIQKSYSSNRLRNWVSVGAPSCPSVHAVEAVDPMATTVNDDTETAVGAWRLVVMWPSE